MTFRLLLLLLAQPHSHPSFNTHTSTRLQQICPGVKIRFLPPGFLRGLTFEAGQPAPTPRELATGYVIAAVTPVQAGVHEWEQMAGETLFTDFTHGLSGDGETCLLWLLSNSAIGSLPLGLCLSNLKSIGGVAECYRALQGLFPAAAFFGRGAALGE